MGKNQRSVLLVGLIICLMFLVVACKSNKQESTNSKEKDVEEQNVVLDGDKEADDADLNQKEETKADAPDNKKPSTEDRQEGQTQTVEDKEKEEEESVDQEGEGEKPQENPEEKEEPETPKEVWGPFY